MPDLIPLQRTALGQFDDEQFSAWALAAHDRRCPSCRNAERCPAGMRYEAAARNSNDDIPGYRA